MEVVPNFLVIRTVALKNTDGMICYQKQEAFYESLSNFLQKSLV